MTFYEQLNNLRRENHEIEGRIQALGFETTNVRSVQLTMLVDFLVEKEVISQLDRDEFHLKWETFLNDTLVGLEQKAQAAIKDLKRGSNAGLALPTRPNLLLPRNSGRGRRNVRDQGSQSGA